MREMNLQLPTKPAMTYTDCYRLVFVFQSFNFQFATHFLSVRATVRHTLLQFLVFALACANCKCVWLRAGISTLCFLSIVSVPLYSVKLSGTCLQIFVGFLLAKLFSPTFHFSVCRVLFRW